MSDLFPVDPQLAKQSHCDNAKYLAMYERSVKDPDGFWGEMAAASPSSSSLPPNEG